MKKTGLYIRDLKSDFDKQWRLYRIYENESLLKEHKEALISKGWETKQHTMWDI